MEGFEEWSIRSTWEFRNSNYNVCADVREDVLVVQVEEKLTGNRWRGHFEPKRKCWLPSDEIVHPTP
jgi:hypothetical protein